MSKKPVAYIKPQDPSFLVKLKKEIGYVEGPTVETKREAPNFDSTSDDQFSDDKPVVVVLNEGDITAEEAEVIENSKLFEESNKKADLSQRVIFQRPTGSKRVSEEETKPKKKSKKIVESKKSLLSFDDQED